MMTYGYKSNIRETESILRSIFFGNYVHDKKQE